MPDGVVEAVGNTDGEREAVGVGVDVPVAIDDGVGVDDACAVLVDEGDGVPVVADVGVSECVVGGHRFAVAAHEPSAHV